jgi:GNAT superfamily N-acetyltransferase
MKIATHEDFDTIYEMAMHFLEASPYKDLGDKDTIAVLIGDILNSAPSERIIVFSEGGFIVGAVTPFLFGPYRLATEVAWWVEPEHRGNGEGLKLLEAFEYWAKNVAQAKLISMSSLDKTVEKYYRKSGYKLYERAYMKVL